MRPQHSKRSQPLLYYNLSCVRTRMRRNSSKSHLAEDLITYDFTLHLRARDHNTAWCWRWCWDGLGTLSFRLSQCHGLGSWLVWEAALKVLFYMNTTRWLSGGGRWDREVSGLIERTGASGIQVSVPNTWPRNQKLQLKEVRWHHWDSCQRWCFPSYSWVEACTVNTAAT